MVPLIKGAAKQCAVKNPHPAAGRRRAAGKRLVVHWRSDNSLAFKGRRDGGATLLVAPVLEAQGASSQGRGTCRTPAFRLSTHATIKERKDLSLTSQHRLLLRLLWLLLLLLLPPSTQSGVTRLTPPFSLAHKMLPCRAGGEIPASSCQYNLPCPVSVCPPACLPVVPASTNSVLYNKLLNDFDVFEVFLYSDFIGIIYIFFFLFCLDGRTSSMRR